MVLMIVVDLLSEESLTLFSLVQKSMNGSLLLISVVCSEVGSSSSKICKSSSGVSTIQRLPGVRGVAGFS